MGAMGEGQAKTPPIHCFANPEQIGSPNASPNAHGPQDARMS